MTLRRKNLILLSLTLLLLLLLLDITFTRFLRNSASELDQSRMEQNLSRVVLSINGEAQMLNAVSELWANSDAAWLYMRGHNPSFPELGLDRQILTTLGVSSMIFLDNDKKVRLFKDYSTLEEPSSPESEFLAIFVANPQNMELFNDLPIMGVKGIVQRGNEPVLFSLQPILDSAMQGPQAGYLVVTRTLNASLLLHITRNISFNFAIEPVTNAERNDPNLPAVVLRDNRAGEGSTVGRKLVRDHRGDPSFWVIGIMKKTDLSDVERKMQKLFLLLAGVAVLFCLLYDRFFKLAFTDKVDRLRDEIVRTRDISLTKAHVTTDNGKDELSSLARTLNDTFAYLDFSKESKEHLEDITLKVYQRFADAGNHLCMKTLEDIATRFTPRDENMRSTIPRAAEKARAFAENMGMDGEESLYTYMGALFSRIGLLGLPFAIRSKNMQLTPEQLREYKKYPVLSRDYLESIELLRPATDIPYCWRENWDGTGFPRGLSGSAIPLPARIFAVVNEWNELTRPWLGRRIPSDEEVETTLRERAGTRLDPQLVEMFIQMLREEKEAERNEEWKL
ncbi:hypothetical protein LJC40_01245 [Synergistaceae bacterium OttesenSCG-928-D05]|nr:hypothetical protein [Synergistaceae bacterium OttesenSCG-928-D05]